MVSSPAGPSGLLSFSASAVVSSAVVSSAVVSSTVVSASVSGAVSGSEASSFSVLRLFLPSPAL